MMRTPLQPGPATDHYHDALGVAQAAPADGLSVDNGVDPPFDASTLVAPGATESAPGEATLAVSVYQTTVTLTNAQIKALPTTPVVLVPAPAAGQTIVFLRGGLVLDSTAGGYTNLSDDGFLLLQHGGGDASNYVRKSVLDGAGARFYNLTPVVYIGSGDYAGLLTEAGPAVEVSLDIGAYNVLGDYTGGHADNTMRLTVYYLIVDVSL